MSQRTITPPECLGIIGGGQLGRMFAISAKQMGYKVALLEPDLNCPARQFADYHITTGYDDKTGLDELAKVSAVITTEFENVPATSLEYLEQSNPVYPSSKAILIAQNRLQEKDFFNKNDVPTTKYCSIINLSDIENVDKDMFPAILKTNTLGYDGKGQIRVAKSEDLELAFIQLHKVPCILEKMVDLKLEVSVVVARNSRETMTFPVAENIHVDGILDLSIAPARIDNSLSNQIILSGLTIADKLNYIGVLAIEFFITKDGQVLANEMAPRPHNSGHYSIDAATTSQFEQQVRSICNLKLGKTQLTNSVIMINLLGDIWPTSTTHPQWENLLAKYSNAKLHLYDKLVAKPGRKMGHITITGDNITSLEQQAQQIKLELGIK